MTHTRTACNPSLIDQFVSEELDNNRLQQLEDHLSVCELCQSQFNERLSSLDVLPSLAYLKSNDEHNSQPDIKSSPDEILTNFAAKFFPAADDERLLGRIDQFELVEPIGSGGMGLVYKAFDRPLHRYVALKVLSPAIATTGAAKQRFIREAQAAAAIHSPFVVPIYAVSEFDGLPYIVMQFQSGVNLQEYLDQTGPLSIGASLKIAHQIAIGLVAAHQQGVIHRDVKPANILIEPTVLKASLTDFGLALVTNEASLTHSGMTPGTPSYMSPEQSIGSSVDQRTDWYSLGCVLYAMLVGHPPFRGAHAYEILSRLQHESPRKPSEHRREIQPWLDKLVMMMLAKDVNQRLANGEQTVELLNDCLMHIDNPGEHEVPALLCKRSRIRKPIGFVLAIASAAMVSIVVFSWLKETENASGEMHNAAMELGTTQSGDSSQPTSIADQRTDEEYALQARLRLEQLQMQDEPAAMQLRKLKRDVSSAELKE